jgi:hypothetical protein
VFDPWGRGLWSSGVRKEGTTKDGFHTGSWVMLKGIDRGICWASDGWADALDALLGRETSRDQSSSRSCSGRCAYWLQNCCLNCSSWEIWMLLGFERAEAMVGGLVG